MLTSFASERRLLQYTTTPIIKTNSIYLRCFGASLSGDGIPARVESGWSRQLNLRLPCLASSFRGFCSLRFNFYRLVFNFDVRTQAVRLSFNFISNEAPVHSFSTNESHETPCGTSTKTHFLLGGLGSRPLCVQLALSFSDASTVLRQPPLASEVECCISRP